MHAASASISLKLYWDGVRRIGIIIKPFARFPSVPASHYQPLQQWRRRKAAFAKLVKHHLRDVVRCIESNKIQKREWAHGIATTQLHGIVDVRDRPNAFFIGANRIKHVRNQEPVYDEACFVTGPDRNLAQALTEIVSGFKNRVIGGDGAYN